MPYIKKEMRPIFNWAVHMATQKTDEPFKYVARRLVIDCIEFGVKDMPPEVMDGCLNYAFTQLLRKMNDLNQAKIIIGVVLEDLFWKRPKYIRFERARGMLACMIEEYQKRAWRRQREVVKVLKALIHSNSIWMSEYEWKKQVENGDLE